MATGLELGLARLGARRQPRRVGDDGDSSTEFVSKLKRDREAFKRDHPLPPLPSGAADAASKRRHVVAPPASPAAQPPSSPAPPPYELLVESPDGDVQSYPVDPALPLRDTLLCHDLPPDWHLRLDGDRLDTAQPARDLGLAHGAVLQSFAPQTGGGDEEDNGLDKELRAELEEEHDEALLAEEGERQMDEAYLPEQQPTRRRQRTAVEPGGAGGATSNEGSDERPARRQRQRVESEDDEWEGDELEGDESEDDGSDDGADERDAQQAANREAQQARQTKAQEASARAAKFQAQQRERVHAPAIADSGVQPWDGVER